MGEPPAIAICAAIGNAVANAIGVRVPHMPMTPDHVLTTLEGRNAINADLRICQSHDRAGGLRALLGARWGEADVLAGGTDLISLMKEHLHTPKRVVNIKNIKELEGIQKTGDGLRIGALVTMDELAE